MKQRIQQIDPATAQGQAKRQLDGIAAQLGSVPNIFKTLAQSPTVLKGYLNFSGALAGGTLDAKLREQIALTVAGFNGCDYCASAHSFLARAAGVDEAEAARNLQGKADDARTGAALQFAQILVVKRAQVTDDELSKLSAMSQPTCSRITSITSPGRRLTSPW